MTRARTLAVPAAILGVISGGVAILILLSSIPLTGWAYADWVAVSATTREALVYAGPWLAGWSAWTAGRYLGPRSLLCPPSAARSGLPVVASQLILLSVAALTGFLLGLAPVLVSTTVRAEAGSLDWLVVAGSAAVLLSFGALGYLIGCATPRAASVVIAVFVTFAAILLVDSWGPAVAPLRLSTPAAGQYENGVVAVFRAVFFAALAVVLTISASRLVADRSSVRQASSFLGLLILVPPLLLGMVARSTAQGSVLKEAQPAQSCTSVHNIPVCVHAAKAALLPSLAETVDRVMGSVNYQPAVPVTGVFDAALGRAGRTDAVVLDLQTGGGQDWTAWAAGDLAGYLAGYPACAHRGEFSGDQVSPALDQTAVSIAFSSWIASSAHFAPPQLNADPSSAEIIARLQQLPTGQAQALYHRFAPQLAACQLPSSALV